jgi:proton glutamate symport protein
MPRTLQLLLALLAGLAIGLGVSSLGPDAPSLVLGAVRWLEPVGQLWVNAIRMTVIPLVVSALVVGVTSAPNPRSVGRIGARALVLFVLMLGTAASLSVVIGAPLMASLSLDPAAVDALRASAASASESASAARAPTFAEWIVSLVPVNPIRAAADGAMLPLIIFSVVFAAALTQVAAERRAPVVKFFDSVQEASLVLVRAILVVAPLGVFALAVPLAAKLGLSAVGALAGYVGMVSAMMVAFSLLVLYPLAAWMGGVSLRTFARASLPAQGIAFSSRSSLAAIPAMLDGVNNTLALPKVIGGFFIPLAASMFRVGATIVLPVGALFLAKLYGVELGLSQYIAIALTSVITSFSVPGVPGGSIIVMVPVLAAAGIPIEGIGILLGVDTIPDMFRTTTNVTGHLSASVILARGESGTPDGSAKTA